MIFYSVLGQTWLLLIINQLFDKIRSFPSNTFINKTILLCVICIGKKCNFQVTVNLNLLPGKKLVGNLFDENLNSNHPQRNTLANLLARNRTENVNNLVHIAHIPDSVPRQKRDRHKSCQAVDSAGSVRSGADYCCPLDGASATGLIGPIDFSAHNLTFCLINDP